MQWDENQTPNQALRDCTDRSLDSDWCSMPFLDRTERNLHGDSKVYYQNNRSMESVYSEKNSIVSVMMKATKIRKNANRNVEVVSLVVIEQPNAYAMTLEIDDPAQNIV